MSPGRDRVSIGIGLGVLAYSLFALHDATNKYLVGFLPLWQVLCLRSAVIVVACLAIGRGTLLIRAATTPLKRPLLCRGGITLAAWMCFYTAAKTLPLAQLMTLYFSSPIMTLLLAIPMLGERISRARWISLAVGFAGVLLASDPLALRLSGATGLVLIAAALWGYAIILMRQIARHESSLVQILYQNVFFLVVTGVLSAVSWQAPTGWQLLLMLAVGVLGGAGQFALFEAARLAEASVLATVEYTALLWAFLLGYLIFSDLPTAPTTAGAGLIFAAGVYLFIMERRAARLVAVGDVR